MTDFLEDHPKLAIGTIVVAALAIFGVQALVKRHNDKTIALIAEAEGDGGARTASTTRLQNVHSLLYKKPDRAVQMLERILQQPEDGTEASQAKELHPNALHLCFHARLKTGDLAEAQRLLQVLGGRYPASHHHTSVRRAWSENRKALLRAHLRDREFREAKEILQELATSDLLFGDSRVLAEYQRLVAESWVKAGERPEELATLAEAAFVLAEIGGGSPLARVMRRSRISGNDLLALANSQDGSNRYRAIPLYDGVLGRLNQEGWFGKGKNLEREKKELLEEQVEYKLAKLYGELGSEMEAGRRPLLTALDPEEIFHRAGGQLRTPAVRAFLVRREIRLQSQRLQGIGVPVHEYSLEELARGSLSPEKRAALEKVLREAGTLVNEILYRSGARLWAAVVRDPKFDPWPLLPPEMRNEFDDERQRGRTEESLRQSLASRAGSRKFPVPLPELQQWHALEREIDARRGLIHYATQPTECVRWVRRALAGEPEAAFRERVVTAVLDAMLNSRGQGRFEAFYELTRYFVGEIGVENLPAARAGKFRAALGEAAASLEENHRPKALFLHAIQAQAYAEDPGGKAARAKAMRMAYELVARSNLTKVEAADLPPCGLRGHSVLSIDNSTEHHLLVFYRGPDSFFLACRPHRKASAVLQDGRYEVAVLTPSGGIVPYRGETLLQGSWLRSNYRLGSDQDKQAPKFASTAYRSTQGEDRLVYKSPGIGPVEIDPRSGGVVVPAAGGNR